MADPDQDRVGAQWSLIRRVRKTLLWAESFENASRWAPAAFAGRAAPQLDRPVRLGFAPVSALCLHH